MKVSANSFPHLFLLMQSSHLAAPDASNVRLTWVDGSMYAREPGGDPILVGPQALIGSGDDLPDQTGNAGKVLKTDGSNLSWEEDIDTDTTYVLNDLLPAQPGNLGKVLKTDGTNATWEEDEDTIATLQDLLPDQTGNATKVLKTDGTSASWQDDEDTDTTYVLNDLLPAQAGNATKVLKTDGTNASWETDLEGLADGGATIFTELGDVPSSYSGQGLKVLRVNSSALELEFFDIASYSYTGGVGIPGFVPAPGLILPGAFLRYDGSWRPPQFAELGDTAGALSGHADALLRINSSGDQIEYAASGVEISQVGKAKIRKNSSGSTFYRHQLNFIEGSNVTLTVADDAGNDEIDITIAAASGGGASGETTTASSPATGATTTINTSSQNETVYLTPAATIATHTVTFPVDGSSALGQKVKVRTTKKITALTVNGTGLTFVGGLPVGLGVNQEVNFQKVGTSLWAVTSISNWIDNTLSGTYQYTVLGTQTNSASYIGLHLAVKGTNNKGLSVGLAGPPDGTTNAGNVRGSSAIDLQIDRNANTQVASGGQSVIGGGSRNTCSGGKATIAGGYQNTCSGYASVVAGGTLNNAGTTNYSAILGGYGNTASAYRSAVVGGASNVSSGNYSLTHGLANTASGVYAVAFGRSGVASQLGQWTHSSFIFSIQPGACQGCEWMMGRTTTNATPAELTLNATAPSASTRLIVIDKSTLGVYITLVARNDVNTDYACFRRFCVITRNGSTTALVGTVQTEGTDILSAGATSGGWAVAVTADDTNECLAITVTGESGKTISWVAVVRATEVGIK